MIMINDHLPKFDSSINVKSKRVIVRVDFNVPLENGRITDDYRVIKTLPLLHDLRARGAHLILISHLTEKKEHRSFEPLLGHLSEICKMDLFLAHTIKEAESAIGRGSVVLLENLRAFSGEETNDGSFAKALAALGDLYINEDFSQSHRPYASILTLPALLSSYAGPLFVTEVEKLKEILHPAHPFLMILGGMKFSTKVGVLDHFLDVADSVYIVGAIANAFLDAAGHEIGKSPADTSARDDIKKRFLHHPKLHLPVDALVQTRETKKPDEVGAEDAIYDAGPATLKELEHEIGKAAMVLWNGPLGYIENGFTAGTKNLLSLLASAPGKVIVGGGDTMVLIRKLGYEDSFYHLSTGGGAMLEFLAKGTLPGIEALLNNKHV